jgi:hypothetical protein
MIRKLGRTVYFHPASTDAAGEVESLDETPTFTVLRNNVAIADLTDVEFSPSKLADGVTEIAGAYRGSFVLSADDYDFAVGDEWAVLATSVKSGQARLAVVSEGVVSAVDAETLDGVNAEKIVNAVIAALIGVAAPTSEGVSFKRQDGTTEAVAITIGTEPGQRTACTLPS